MPGALFLVLFSILCSTSSARIYDRSVSKKIQFERGEEEEEEKNSQQNRKIKSTELHKSRIRKRKHARTRGKLPILTIIFCKLTLFHFK